jgi:hypothetical protein
MVGYWAFAKKTLTVQAKRKNDFFIETIVTYCEIKREKV